MITCLSLEARLTTIVLNPNLLQMLRMAGAACLLYNNPSWNRFVNRLTIHFVWNYTTTFHLPLLIFLLICYNRDSQTARERALLTRVKTLLFMHYQNQCNSYGDSKRRLFIVQFPAACDISRIRNWIPVLHGMAI